MSRLDGELANQCTHKLEHYGDIIEGAKEEGYAFTTFRGYRWAKSKRVIILRHDVDWRLDNGLEMAKIERELNVRSTFFIRLHAADYNPFEYNAYLILRQLLKWGFELGLHFEVADMAHVTGENELSLFKREKYILETIVKKKIVSASAHGGYSGLDYYGRNYFFNKYKKEQVDIENHTFEKRFWDDMKFISDGYGFWREGCPCHYIGRVDKMHISTHPKWWFHDSFYLESGGWSSA